MNIDEAIRIALLETALEVALEQRDAALVEAERVQDIVTKVKAWRAELAAAGWTDEEAAHNTRALIAAVDALEAAEAEGREAPDA